MVYIERIIYIKISEINHVYLVFRYTQGVHGVHCLINHLMFY